MHPVHAPQAPSSALPPLVLDTNVLLDWLVFQDPSTAALDNAIRCGTRQWVATSAMREELERVLTREYLACHQSDPHLAMATWHRWVRPVDPITLAQPGAMRCTDPDDQKFIDLALQLGAVLLSRDRAVLRLARAGRQRGIQIMSAAAWAAASPLGPPISG